MLLADLGADVVAVERPAVAAATDRSQPATNPLMRGKRSVALDLKLAGPRGTNHLDDAAPFYNVYATSDGRWVAVGAIEAPFHAELDRRLGLDEPAQWDRAAWPAGKEALAAVFRTRTREEWRELLEGTEACFAPVLAPGEVPQHPHMAARGTVIEQHGIAQGQAAPRFSRTPATASPPCHPGEHDLDEIVAGWR
jgi:crotonobetainyl-CoA:carnitine CoA-transferase CaiB-like acyl-CoA transferase